MTFVISLCLSLFYTIYKATVGSFKSGDRMILEDHVTQG